MPADITTINPATGESLQRYDHTSEQEVDRRLDIAVGAQREWRRSEMAERSRRLQDLSADLLSHKESLAALCTAEMGKLTTEAIGEVEKSALGCRYYAQHGPAMLTDEALPDELHRKSFISHHPLGLVFAVMPWNFPFWQVFRCAAPALMAGNAVVLKHASNVSGCALEIERIFSRAGFADGLFSTLLMPGKRASALIADDRIAAASLTGSEGAGSAVGAAAGKALKPSVLELGGSDPFVVLDLGHEKATLDMAVKSRFQNAGQSCIAAKRFIVVDQYYDRFMEGFLSRVEKLNMGDPTDATTGLAPMAREDLRDEVHSQVENARKSGATVHVGGVVPDRPGAFYPATVISDIDEKSALYREEVFGPVASVYRVADADQAIELANDSDFGLGGSVWTGDPARGIEVAKAIESGAVYVNRMMSSDPRLPFGGIGRSGYGRELSHLGIREFVNQKTISVELDV